ncbi:MAG: hypothetical protein JNK15_25885 [Planctomycetes bacterium]|nr:hypothetical protein [Planctomycetota bacterium]
MTPNDLRARLRDLAAPAILTVLALNGTVDVTTAQGKQPLAAGSSRTIDVGAARAASARARQLYQQVRKDLPPPADEASMIARKELDERFQELIALVLQQPAAAAGLRGAVVQDLADASLGAEPRARVAQLALLDGDAATFAAVTRAWPLDPGAFGFESQIALAERGFAPAKAMLREQLAEPHGPQTARVAAALAVGGDDSVRATLRPFLDADVAAAGRDFQAFDARCHAAVAMQALGDPEPVRQLRAALVAQVEAWIASADAQQLALADWCLQRGEYWLGAQRPRLSWPDLRLRAATPQRAQPDAAALRARAAALAPK